MSISIIPTYIQRNLTQKILTYENDLNVCHTCKIANHKMLKEVYVNGCRNWNFAAITLKKILQKKCVMTSKLKFNT